MGLEPTPSGLTGRRYNQLNYDPGIKDITYSKNPLLPLAVMRTGLPSRFLNFHGRRNRT
jgi:hypothetical protein